MKTLTLEQTGLVIELFSDVKVYVTYSACTHGGWAKYVSQHPLAPPVANFEQKSEIIEDANRLAKYYNSALVVLI